MPPRPRRVVSIGLYKECMWCGGTMKRGTCFMGGRIEHVAYFCQDCGSVAHFGRDKEKKITGIEVSYEYEEEGSK